jgi:UrcA family protein
MSRSFVQTTLSAILALGVSLAAHTVAAETLQPVSVKVVTSDLDLSKSSDARRMLKRIRLAAEDACFAQDSDVVRWSTSYLPCVTRTTDQAVGRLDSPLVTALNQGDHHTPVVLASRR